MSPKIAIILTTFIEKNKHYLDQAIESIHRVDYDNLQIILVGKKSYKPYYEGVLTVAPDSDEFPNSAGINFGVKYVDQDAKYIFIMNDDAILTKNSLKNLVRDVGDDKAIANALSPCDNYLVYRFPMGFKKDGRDVILADRFYTYDQLKENFNEMMEAKSYFEMDHLKSGHIVINWLCLYASLFPKKCFDDVGPWDENYQTGQDDLDFCIRAKQHGYEFRMVLDSLIWHFGGVSAATTTNFSRRIKNIEYFKNKWGFWPVGMTDEYVQDLKNKELEELQRKVAFEQDRP